MCKPASMIETADKMYWSEKTDSHSEIITEFGLCESGVRGVNVVPIEVCPPKGNLSLPLSKWVYSVDYAEMSRELPEWYDEERSKDRAKAALKEWAQFRLKGWEVKEAFNPVNPLKVKRDKTLDLPKLVAEWASVWDSVWASVRASVWGYIGSLFTNIKDWKYLPGVKNPWSALRKLWLGGYVPSFDGTTWRLHAGLKAEIVFEIKASELPKIKTEQ